MPKFGLIIIGDEILSGKRADKHMVKVIEILAQRGLQLSYANYVGDDPDRITAALKAAFDSGDVVFSTGGIGATLNTSFDRYEYDTAAAILLIIIGIVMALEYISGVVRARVQ